jgi:antirestriction protein ArdC
MSVNVYEIINNRIMELLEQGTIPWRKPWNAEGNYPKNLISRKEYRGINIFLLACQQYSSPYWLTFKQAQEKGGHVIKGSKSTPVIFWKWLDRKEADGETSINGKIPMLRYYSVFNIEQVEGISAPDPQETVNDFSPIEKAEQIIASMPLRPDIKYGGNKAYYSPVLDYVQIPDQHTFNSAED